MGGTFPLSCRLAAALLGAPEKHQKAAALLRLLSGLNPPVLHLVGEKGSMRRVPGTTKMTAMIWRYVASDRIQTKSPAPQEVEAQGGR
jgi:hypothetical protein